jgi:hypothetical protein
MSVMTLLPKGTPTNPRWVVALMKDEGPTFWDENTETFIDDEDDATLFYENSDAARVLNNMLRKEVGGEVEVHYSAPVVVRLRSKEDVDLAELIAWLHKTCRLILDSRCGTGPVQDSHGYISIEWDELKHEGDYDVVD